MRSNFFLIICVLIIFKINIIAQDIDVYCGKYTDTTMEHKLSFAITLDGIKDLNIKGVKIENQKVGYNLLGYFGSSLLLEIYYDGSDSCRVSMKMLIQMVDEKFINAIGCYVKSKYIQSTNTVEIYDEFVYSLEFIRKIDW